MTQSQMDNMTFDQIEGKYLDSTPAQRATILHNMDHATRCVWDAIKILESRKGFSHWWGNLEPECYDEIFQELIAAFRTN